MSINTSDVIDSIVNESSGNKKNIFSEISSQTFLFLFSLGINALSWLNSVAKWAQVKPISHLAYRIRQIEKTLWPKKIGADAMIVPARM